MFKANVLDLKSVRNPRDLGGYETTDNYKIKTNRLIRSGRISGISAADAAALKSYGLVKIIDLRTPYECSLTPDSEIPGVQHYNVSISYDDTTKAAVTLKELEKQYPSDPLAGFRQMCDSYRKNVLSAKAQSSFQQLFKIMAQTKTGAIMFHCSEGKDRTGLVTLFLLYILGVDMETIRQDYLFSNGMLDQYRADRDRRAAGAGANFNTRACMRSLGSVANEYLDAALIAIDEHYGSLDNYVEKQLGVSSTLKKQLRQLYLEKQGVK